MMRLSALHLLLPLVSLAILAQTQWKPLTEADLATKKPAPTENSPSGQCADKFHDPILIRLALVARERRGHIGYGDREILRPG